MVEYTTFNRAIPVQLWGDPPSTLLVDFRVNKSTNCTVKRSDRGGSNPSPT